jgi:hypothetical protein
MSLKSLIASTTLGVFLVSFCFAEDTVSGPGKSMPVDSMATVEESAPLMLDSAPAEQDSFISMTDVLVKPSKDTAEVIFTTNIPTYATIEYGLTAEPESVVTTETMTAHIETLANLITCRTYFYRVLATSADDVTLDTAREGTFMTKGCVVKKSVPVPAPVVQPVAVPSVVEISAPESEMLALPLESDLMLNAAPNKRQNLETIQNE